MKKRRTRLSYQQTLRLDRKLYPKIVRKHQKVMARLRPLWEEQHDSHVGDYQRHSMVLDYNEKIRSASTKEPGGTVCTTWDWNTIWWLNDAIHSIYEDDEEHQLAGRWVDDAYDALTVRDRRDYYRSVGRHPDELSGYRPILMRIREALDAPEIVAVTTHVDGEGVEGERMVKFAFSNDHDAIMFKLNWS